MSEMSEASINANQLLFTLAGIGLIGILGAYFSAKIKIPDVVIYLLAGIVCGPGMLGIINLEDFSVANEIIFTFGSAFILFEGGREIKLKVLNHVKVTVGLLSTVGVVVSTIIVGGAAAYVFDFPIMIGMLLGAIIASTDPATLIPVFSQISIRNKLKQTVVSESAFNDAIGAILVSSIIGVITVGEFSFSQTSINLLIMIVVGTLVGLVTGIINLAFTSDRFYGIFSEFTPIISVLTVIFAYELADRFHGSGFMAVFIAGLLAGNKKMIGMWIPEEYYKKGIHFTENIAILCRMSIFVVLGTQVDLGAVVKYGLPSFGIVIILMFIARPIVVLLSGVPDRKAKWEWKELLFMMWVRETGVIPAALSGMVVSMKIPGYEIISAVVFMTILVTLVLQASTTKMVAEKLDVLE